MLLTHSKSEAIPEEVEENVLNHREFDTLILNGTRLEMYVREDFSGDCAPCLMPHHVNCQGECYLKARNLSLVCSASVKGLSLGPFDRTERGKVLRDLYKTDSVIIATGEGETFLQGSRISSQSAGLEGMENFSVEIEGFRGFRSVLEQSVTAGLESFQIRVGTYVLSTQLRVDARSHFSDFIRQCPGD